VLFAPRKELTHAAHIFIKGYKPDIAAGAEAPITKGNSNGSNMSWYFVENKISLFTNLLEGIRVH